MVRPSAGVNWPKCPFIPDEDLVLYVSMLQTQTDAVSHFKNVGGVT